MKQQKHGWICGSEDENRVLNIQEGEKHIQKKDGGGSARIWDQSLNILCRCFTPPTKVQLMDGCDRLSSFTIWVLFANM